MRRAEEERRAREDKIREEAERVERELVGFCAYCLVIACLQARRPQRREEKSRPRSNDKGLRNARQILKLLKLKLKDACVRP